MPLQLKTTGLSLTHSLGPEIEIIYPPDIRFSTADLSAICFNRLVLYDITCTKMRTE